MAIVLNTPPEVVSKQDLDKIRQVADHIKELSFDERQFLLMELYRFQVSLGSSRATFLGDYVVFFVNSKPSYWSIGRVKRQSKKTVFVREIDVFDRYLDPANVETKVPREEAILIAPQHNNRSAKVVAMALHQYLLAMNKIFNQSMPRITVNPSDVTAVYPEYKEGAFFYPHPRWHIAVRNGLITNTSSGAPSATPAIPHKDEESIDPEEIPKTKPAGKPIGKRKKKGRFSVWTR
jgi:hypothetical protein